MTMCVSPVVPGGDATNAVSAFRLTVPKADALRYVKAYIEQGVAIRRRRRVRYLEDLERARAAKSAWVQDYSDLLVQMFQGDDGDTVAAMCNDWVGRVYPEYAEVALFIEQFYEEMDYRIGRLRQVARRIADTPEYIPMPAIKEPGANSTSLIDSSAPAPAPAAPAPAASAAPAAAPAKLPTPQAKPAEPVDEVAEAVVSGLLVVHTCASPTGTQQAVEQFLQDLGMEVCTLPPGPREGKSAVVALERHPNATFAVLLLGRDDTGASSPDASFELGYLVGRLGLPRVCVLREPGGGEPAANGAAAPAVDAHGIACLTADPTGGWQLQLARHLKRAGIEIDLNKLC